MTVSRIRGEMSGVTRFLNRLPLYVSFAILLSTWTAFTFVLAIHETFLKREETGRFVFQFVVFNGLMGMTMLSLATASSRGSGNPDPLLAPFTAESLTPLDEEQEKLKDHRPAPLALPAPIPEGEEERGESNEDDIPLRYLRNSQWVSTRISKARPSPLPLRTSRPGASTSHPHPTLGTSGFPLAMSPFVPTTPADAGEDDAAEDEAVAIEGGSGSARLLPHNEPGREMELGGRSTPLMAKSANGGPRWCRKCDMWKPDRCHHCSFCKTCVLKMDHHCVWVGSCVGYRNYKPFLLFISYGTLTAIYTFAESFYALWRFFVESDPLAPSPPTGLSHININVTSDPMPGIPNAGYPHPRPVEVELAPVVFMILAITSAFFTLSVGGLAGFHWYLVLTNSTTLENMTHSYPSALLPDLASPSTYTPARPSFHGGRAPRGAMIDVRRWRGDHLLSRRERVRLREEARAINVYDLGWRRNLRAALVEESPWNLASHGVGKGRRGWWRDIAYAAWPMAPVQGGDGHSFAYDPQKLAKLRELTEELRLGYERAADREGMIGQEGAAEEWSEDEDDDDEESDLEEYSASPSDEESRGETNARISSASTTSGQSGVGGGGGGRIAWLGA